MSADFLNVTVTPYTAEETAEAIGLTASGEDQILLGAHNLHSVYLLHTNDRFREFYDAADIVLVDGWPVLASLNRARSRAGLPEYAAEYRVGSTDWIPRAVQQDGVSRVCVIGASQASNARFIQRQSEASQHIEFRGYPADPWDATELPALIAEVLSFRPHLVLVGMGMPLQEEVALALHAASVPGVIATVGGAIDQLSGEQTHAPRWTGRLRVEWLWRLASHPRRLAYRYLVEPMKLFVVLRTAKRTQ